MLPMYHRYFSEIDIKHQNIYGSTTSLDTKNEKHQLLLIEGQINLYRPVSIEKMSPVERQVKDTSSASITTVTFKNQGTQRALYSYKVPNFMPFSIWESATQSRYHTTNRIQRSSTPMELDGGAGPTNRADQSRDPHPHLHNKTEKTL